MKKMGVSQGLRDRSRRRCRCRRDRKERSGSWGLRGRTRSK